MYVFLYSTYNSASQRKPLLLSFIISAEERIITLSFSFKESLKKRWLVDDYVFCSVKYANLLGLPISDLFFHKYWGWHSWNPDLDENPTVQDIFLFKEPFNHLQTWTCAKEKGMRAEIIDHVKSSEGPASALNLSREACVSRGCLIWGHWLWGGQHFSY